MEDKKIFSEGLIKQVILENAGDVIPLVFKWDHNYGVSLMNPSIYNDNGIIKACVRCVNYTLHHSEKGLYPHWYSPLQYIHPENDVRLATENFLVTFDNELNVNSVKHIDMLNLHNPIWGFHGLEDGRLFRWNKKLYICGVRRDTTDNGQGRMEMTELQEFENTVKEISRTRIPAPGDDSSYCEKNWMPILDQPNKFVTWSNPTNIVTWYPETNTVSLENKQSNIIRTSGVRGGSQVVKYKDYYIAVGHSVDLWKPYAGEKDSTYYSHFMIWDKDFNLITITDGFKFMNSGIEFCPGMCLDNNNQLLISFSDEDNAAYILKVDPDWLLNKVLKNE